MTKNAAEQYCFRSTASFIRCTILCVWSIVECLCLKPKDGLNNFDIEPTYIVSSSNKTMEDTGGVTIFH
jgi:hypothetical protein